MASTYFGVREFVNLVLFLIGFYLRHKENIDNAVGPEVASALQTVSDASEAIRALNEFGPL